MKTKQSSKKEIATTQQPLSRRRRIGVALLLTAWVAVSFSVASLIAYLIMRTGLETGIIAYDAVTSSLFGAVLTAMVYLFTTVIVIGLPLKLKKARISLEELGLQRLPSWQDILLAPASFVVYLILSGTLVAIAMKLFPGFDVGQAQDVGFSDISQRYEYVLAFLTLVVIAPVAEEVLFRGYLYGKLRRVIPMIPAMLVTAALFGALHMQWNVALDVFALSLVMTSLREASGSISAGILLHMLKNAIAFYVLFINPTFLTTMGM